MRKLISLVLLGFSVGAVAEVYRWVDSEGKLHYGDHAPAQAGIKATAVPIQSSTTTPDTDAERNRDQLRAIREGRLREQEYAAQQAQQTQQRREELAKKCRELQYNIRREHNAATYYRIDDAGNRQVWTDEERAAYHDQLQRQKETYCPDLPD